MKFIYFHKIKWMKHTHTQQTPKWKKDDEDNAAGRLSTARVFDNQSQLKEKNEYARAGLDQLVQMGEMCLPTQKRVYILTVLSKKDAQK